MNLINKIIIACIQSGQEVTMSLSGISMLPTMHGGDKVTIRKMDNYVPGDIIAFIYKDNQMLVHRLIMIKDNRYYIKGDNTLRMEDVEISNIIGKVVLINGKEIAPTLSYVVALSYLVNRCFHNSGYCALITMQSGIYRFYKQYMNNSCDDTLVYEKNNLVYRENCKKHFDDLESRILSVLDTPHDYKSLVAYLESSVLVNSLSDIHSVLNNILASRIVDGTIIVK